MLARISALIAAIYGLAAILFMLNPVTLPSPKAPRAQDDHWQLPQRTAPEIEPLVESIVENKLWGNTGLPAAAVEKSLTPPDWRISGVFSIGKQQFVTLATAGAADQQLSVGDKLPGGAKILAITPDQICILLNRKKLALRTYRE